MATCKECLHVAVCGRYAATGGRVRDCEHFAGDNNVDGKLEALRKKVAELEKSNRNWRRKIQRIRQRYAKKNHEWIPVTERLPGFDTERVLVMTQGDLILGYPKMDTDRYVNGNWVRYGDHVTHWMPLPEPPEEVE